MAAAVKHFLDAFPLKTMRPGDHYITNDPWLTCGHLHDLTVVSPTFLHGEPVGLFASTVHVVDIGGLGMGPDGRQVFEEGLSIPLMALAREGRMNEDLLRVIRANVREPLQVEGDVYALAACNDEGSRRLVEMMEEFGIANLDRLGRAHHRNLARGDDRGDRQAEAGQVHEQPDDGRLRPAADPAGRDDDRRRTASMSTMPAPRRPAPSASMSC